MNDKKILKQTTEIETIDFETGELKQVTKEKRYSIPQEPPYIKMYLEDIAKLKGLRKSHLIVLCCLLEKMNYANENGQVIYVNSVMKKEILNSSKELNSTQTVTDAISALKKKEILLSVGRSTYRINPQIFGKGDWRDILKLREIKMIITYNYSGRNIQTETTEQKQKPKK